MPAGPRISRQPREPKWRERSRPRGVLGGVAKLAASSAGLLATLVVGSAGCARSAGERSVERPPLVGTVVILVDTLRADHLGCYGSELALTPVIDGVAARGALFERAVAPSSWTRPTVASLFASRYPSSIGVLGDEDAIASEVVTLAEVLRESGFETFAVGTNSHAGRAFGFDQGFDRWEKPDILAGYPEDFRKMPAEGVTRKGLELLDGRVGGRPFFLYLRYIDPHDPYLQHPELDPPGPEPAGRFDGSRRDLAVLDALPAGDVTAADRGRIRHLYAGEVRYGDLWIGKFLQGLEERGLRDRVLVVITSDHGEGLWDHGVRGHGLDLYEELVHVPLIVDAPAAFDGDRPVRVTAPVSLIDVAPTILAAHRMDSPAGFRGLDLAPLTEGQRRPRRHDLVYSELKFAGRDLDALRHADLKLIRDRRPVAGGAFQLYDLAADPGEHSDRARSEPSVAARLERSLDGFARRLLDEAGSSEQVPLSEVDEETLENLRALGYLDGGGGRRR